MKIFIENETRIHYEFEDPAPIIRKAVRAVAKEKGLPEGLEVNVLLTTPSVIRTVNQENRGIDSATDVLSFPYFEYEEPGVFSASLEKGGENILGDILICGSRIKEQAKKYGHSQKRELAFLIVHSMLHLIGYDHMKKADAKLMEEEQKRLMDEVLKIRR
ncbi:MAG: rRNA maturation RNase YbeY [Parasporobacterium sp.]|nr:rRNA maturation RNase YbeY [Parasporobacterium sp.]